MAINIVFIGGYNNQPKKKEQKKVLTHHKDGQDFQDAMFTIF